MSAAQPSRYQYRVTVNDSQSAVLDLYPGERWHEIAERLEARGGQALLERRLVTDAGILKLVVNPAGYIALPDGETVVCPWQALAELDL